MNHEKEQQIQEFISKREAHFQTVTGWSLTDDFGDSNEAHTRTSIYLRNEKGFIDSIMRVDATRATWLEQKCLGYIPRSLESETACLTKLDVPFIFPFVANNKYLKSEIDTWKPNVTGTDIQIPQYPTGRLTLNPVQYVFAPRPKLIGHSLSHDEKLARVGNDRSRVDMRSTEVFDCTYEGLDKVCEIPIDEFKDLGLATKWMYYSDISRRLPELEDIAFEKFGKSWSIGGKKYDSLDAFRLACADHYGKPIPIGENSALEKYHRSPKKDSAYVVVKDEFELIPYADRTPSPQCSKFTEVALNI